MKLLHRVVKSSMVCGKPDSVLIDNTVVLPTKEVFTEQESGEDENQARIEKEKISKQIDDRVEQQVNSFKILYEKEKDEYLKETEKLRFMVLDKAKAEAEKILADSKEIVAKELKKATEDGQRQGFEEGKKQALAECEKYVKTGVQFLSEINAKKEAYYIQNKEELFKICMDMAQKITLQEIKTDKSVLLNIAKEASKNFRNSDYLKISFAKGDVSEDIISDKEFVESLTQNIQDIEVEVLPEAPSGTVILDNNKEILDASVPTQLNLLKEIMNGAKNE